MRPRPMTLLPAALLVLAGAACGSSAPAAAPSASAPPAAADDSLSARAELAALAALAEDKAYAARYSMDDGAGRVRDVVATMGADGTWRVDISGGALGGTTDVSIVSTAAGVFQCTVATAANPITPACVRVAKPGKRVPRRYDPKIQRLFRSALTVFTDRQSALSVTEVEPLSGATGTCFSIDSISASLDAPVDIGIYCYAADGVLTAARVGFGVLTLVNQVPGPATVTLPGPEVAAVPMETASPPPPPVVVEPSSLASPA